MNTKLNQTQANKLSELLNAAGFNNADSISEIAQKDGIFEAANHADEMDSKFEVLDIIQFEVLKNQVSLKSSFENFINE